MAMVDPRLRFGAREAFRRITWPVTVITYRGAGRTYGMTVSSVTSLSLDPPSLVVCINRASRTHGFMTVGAKFGVNVLADHQTDIAGRLSIAGGDKEVDTGDLAQGRELHVPILDDVVAAFVTTVVDVRPTFSHSIVVASVDEVVLGDVAARPLAYREGRFVGPSDRSAEHPAGHVSSDKV